MKKLLLVGAAAALGAVACSPEIGSESPTEVVVAQFDPAASPAQVPSPNDLALNPATGLVAAPIDPNAPEAQREFTRDFVNTLNGFPTTLPATAKIADLDPASVPATVNETSVRLIDLLAGTPIATPEVKPSVSYDDATDTLTIRPPSTGWPKGGRYAVALIGGEGGLKGTNGRRVVGSATWAFARSPEPLVTCEDLTAPDCRTATELIPSSETDPAARLKDQTASALRLEALRRAYKPVLDALERKGVARQDVALLWTFRIVDMPEVTFDPANATIPFPNDILRARQQDGTYRLALPKPANASPQQAAFVDGLNTLDGFSTTAPVVSENSVTRGVLESGSLLDHNKLAAGAKFFKLSNLDKGTQPDVKACLNCASSARADGAPQTSPQQLQFVPQTPLDEQTQYAAVLTTDLMDTRGRRVMPSAAFALLRLKAPLVDANGTSQVSVLNDLQANALEPLRKGFQPLFDGLEQAGLPRAKIALGWAFTTQSTTSVLSALRGLPAQYGQAGLPGTPVYIQDITSLVPAERRAGVKVFAGSAYFPFALTGPGGTLNPTAPLFQRLPFMLAVPAPEGASTGNLPVTLFGHGLTGNRTHMLALAGALASTGRATLALDSPFHGERASCVGSAALTGAQSDDAACANPTSQRCDATLTSPTYGLCVARDTNNPTACEPHTFTGDMLCKTAGLGQCLPTGATTGVCQGGDFLRVNDPESHKHEQPVVAGNILNLTNLFATRDNFRHHVIDTTQLLRVLSSEAFDTQLTAANGGTALTLDETKVDYVGQSLGGMLGTLTVAATPEIHRAVLNVPGADPTSILLSSPDFASARTAFLAALAAQGLTPGSAAFDDFINLGRMVLDPADPQNAAYAMRNSAEAPADRAVLVQYIEGDTTTPNPMTKKLIDAANRNPARTVADYLFTFSDPNTLPAPARHSFLLNPVNPAVTGAAQTQAVGFLATGTLTPAPQF